MFPQKSECHSENQWWWQSFLHLHFSCHKQETSYLPNSVKWGWEGAGTKQIFGPCSFKEKKKKSTSTGQLKERVSTMGFYWVINVCKTCSSLHQDYLPSSHHRAVKGEPNKKMRKLTHSEIKCHIASAVWIRNPCTPESTVFFHLISIKQNSGTKRSLHCLFLPQTRLSFTPCTTITACTWPYHTDVYTAWLAPLSSHLKNKLIRFSTFKIWGQRVLYCRGCPISCIGCLAASLAANSKLHSLSNPLGWRWCVGVRLLLIENLCD